MPDKTNKNQLMPLRGRRRGRPKSEYIPRASMIRSLRNDRGEKQTVVAGSAGISVRTLSNMENGKKVSEESIRLVAEHFSVAWETLVVCDEEQSPVSVDSNDVYIDFVIRAPLPKDMRDLSMKDVEKWIRDGHQETIDGLRSAISRIIGSDPSMVGITFGSIVIRMIVSLKDAKILLKSHRENLFSNYDVVEVRIERISDNTFSQIGPWLAASTLLLTLAILLTAAYFTWTYFGNRATPGNIIVRRTGNFWIDQRNGMFIEGRRSVHFEISVQNLSNQRISVDEEIVIDFSPINAKTKRLTLYRDTRRLPILESSQSDTFRYTANHLDPSVQSAGFSIHPTLTNCPLQFEIFDARSGDLIFTHTIDVWSRRAEPGKEPKEIPIEQVFPRKN